MKKQKQIKIKNIHRAHRIHNKYKREEEKELLYQPPYKLIKII